MSTVELLKELKRRDIKLWAEGARLRYDAPKGALTDELRAAIVAHRAELLELLSGKQRRRDEVPLVARPIEGQRVLSFGQRRLWFLDQLAAGNIAYNVPATVRLRGMLDVAALRRSLSEIASRHEALRSRFPSVAGEAQWVVEPPSEVTLAVELLNDIATEDRLKEATRRARSEAERPFDLAHGPLFRVRLWRLDEADHVLLVTMHHIISDGWSMGRFFKELAALYPALCRGEASPLPELPLQYADYAHWQRAQMERQGLDRELEYWRRQLGGELPVLDLPHDRPRPKSPSHRGGFAWVNIPQALFDQVMAVAKREGVTRFQLLLAAFYVLLAKHCGQDDLVIGTPIAGRSRREVEDLIGFFVDNLVLRADLSGDPSFRELLGRVRTVVLDAFAHQQLPFEKLVEELRPERVPGRNPLFQVLFNHFDLFEYEHALPPLQLSTIDMSLDVSKFDLTLHCYEHEGRLYTKIEYNADLFDAETILSLGAHYRAVLEGVAADVERPISRIDILSEDERRCLLSEWQGLQTPLPVARSVIELFDEQVRRTPEADALVFEDQRLSYQELDRRACALAQRLAKKSVGSEDKVALLIERSAEMIIALLGVLKAGGAYVPIDTSTPPERIVFMLQDSSARVLLARAEQLGSLPPHDALALDLDVALAMPEPSEEPSPAFTAAAASPEQLAYVIYTSGSTGQPKGVEVEHAQLLNYFAALHAQADLDPGSNYATVSTLAADLGNTSIFLSLLGGGCLHVLSEERIGDGDAFGGYCKSQSIDCLKIVPSHLEALMAAAAEPARVLPRKLLILGGEATSWELIERIRALAPHCRLLNHYGPTETTIGVLTHPIEPGDRALHPNGPPIGRPIANTRAYLLDKTGGLVPIGVTGELYIGGRSVTRGYQRRPDLTKSRFVVDPFGASPADRMYKTGDLARFGRDGRLRFLGRADDQIKLRGFRIELGEIQAALVAHRRLSAGAVVVHRDPLGAKRLVAYVAAAPDATQLTATELRAHLRQSLPEHMVPSAFLFLDALPLTKNGKLDRKALPTPSFDRDMLASTFVPPRSAAERTLAQIWCEVLRLERVGMHDNFFELGGESILSIQIISRANQAGLRLLPSDVFESPTVAGLASVAGKVRRTEAEQGVVTGPVPLTPIQHRFFEQELSDAHHYNHAMMLRAQRPVDTEVLQRALAVIERHHDALRLRFHRRADGWEQQLAPVGEPPRLLCEDLSALTTASRREAIEERAHALQSSFDFATGPIWQAALFDMGPQGARLFLVIHHLAVDGISWRLLLEDLQTAYTQLLSGKEPRLPAKTTSYQRWAQSLTSLAQSEELRAEHTYWKSLAKHKAVPLPVDSGSAAADNIAAHADTVEVLLSQTETQALLREVPRAYHTQINDVLLAAVVQVVSAWNKTSSVKIDLEGHGREDLFADIDISRTIGWFTAVYPVVLDIQGCEGPGDRLVAVKEQLRAVPRRGVGWGVLRYLLTQAAPEAALVEPRPAQIGFNYMGHFDQVIEESALFARAPESTGLSTSERNRRRYLLDIGGAVRGGQLRISWTFCTSVHTRKTVEALAERFVVELRGLITHCTEPGVGSHTPSDYKLARLDRNELQSIEERLGGLEIEDIAVLSPLQQGMIFHTLAEPGAPAYVTQLALTLVGELKPSAFRRAWQRALDRHPTLRTAFIVDGLREMHQVVCRDVPIRWHEDDYRSLPKTERNERLAELARADREQGFELAAPPLMQLRLLRVAEQRYRFLWTHHHVLLDGWSLPLLVRDVFHDYRHGQPAAEPPPPFSSYIRWLNNQDAAAAETYWKQRLGGWTEPTPLPSGAEPADPSLAEVRSIATLQLSEEKSAQLAAFARRHHLTLNTLLQGAWALLLSRHSGRAEVLFGVTVSGRPAELSGVEGMVGLFINTLPMRLDTQDQALVPWLRGIQSQQLDIQRFSYSALYELQKLSGARGRGALFNSIVVFESYPAEVAEPLQTSGLRIEDASDVSHATYPLALVVQPQQRMVLQLRYEAAHFRQTQIERLLSHLRTLLGSIANGAEARLADLQMLSRDEVQRQLAQFNDTTRPYPRNNSVQALFEAQAADKPRQEALRYGDQTLSYEELNRRANQLAHHLKALGVEPGSFVAIMLERGPELIVAMLATLKAGAAYVPLDPDYPAERLALMLADSSAAILLTNARLQSRLPHHPGEVVAVDVQAEAIAARPAVNLSRQGTGGDLAYVIYTSGSTGRPNGVCVEHRSIARLVLGTDYIALGADDRIAQASNASFDAATFEIWGALLNGATLVGFSKEEALSPEDMAAALRQRGVTVLFVTTALFNQLVWRVPNIFATLRYVLFGGEAVTPRWVRQVLEHGKPEHLLHVYGPTECTTFSTWYEVTQVEADAATIPIGRSIANSTAYVLDRDRNPAPLGASGELFLGGDGLARGYLGRPELTSTRFIAHPFATETGDRLYKTGDLVRQKPNGDIEFLGRIDHQVKLRGFRIELGEIEFALSALAGIRDVAVLCRRDASDDMLLVAYIAPEGTVEQAPARSELTEQLARTLPEHMIPAAFVFLDELPMNANGKLDRAALPAPSGPQREGAYVAPQGGTEERVAKIWCEVLDVERVGSRDSFFDLGGHSLKLLRVHARLREELGCTLSITELFEYGTVEALARRIDGGQGGDDSLRSVSRARVAHAGSKQEGAIAVIAMAGRFPGASDVETLWQNLCNGVESVRFFSDDELREAGISEELINDPRYVKARAVLDKPDCFDARLFGYTPREAELMDPQQRVFLECAYEALERAGHDPERFAGLIGVYAGASMNSYLENLRSRPQLLAAAGGMQALISSINDFLTTRVSYKLNLRGPSVNVQTACSTSLVAIHEACRSLIERRCDMALAGGVAVTVPWVSGYLHAEGGVRSSDGHCRTFDARAEGMVSGNGAAIVVLRRLQDALADSDEIHAVIGGSAINNDGARKIGFTAPSIEGQAEVIALAQAAAGFEPESIGYVEAHGTGTALGDPIEVAALTRVFREQTKKVGFCALASLKSNMGHLDAAAGAAGLIKAALAVKHGLLPPSLHYEQPNPEIDFAASPFYVNTKCQPWGEQEQAPRRAGVSAFGIGGTNAHAVLEQPPLRAPSGPSRAWQLLALSAANSAALDAATENLAAYLRQTPDVPLADVAYTLLVGRRQLPHRRTVIGREHTGAVEALSGGMPRRRRTRHAGAADQPVVFLFPGQGAQYVNMARGLYRDEPIFREVMDACFEQLRTEHGVDLGAVLYPPDGAGDSAAEKLRMTSMAQPALLSVSYALAQLWRSWGIEPAACIGHSVGEFAAACVAGVLSLSDALRLVVARGRLMEEMPAGVMLVVPQAEEEVRKRLSGREGLWLAAHNGPTLSVVSGVESRIEAFEHELSAMGLRCKRLHTSHAFHSGLMQGAVSPFIERVAGVQMAAPQIPYVSSLSGDWVREADVLDPSYWGRQIREPVRFSTGIERLLSERRYLLLEVGPGETLGMLARQHDSCGRERVVVSSLRPPRSNEEDSACLMNALATMWTAGATIQWDRFYQAEQRHRVTLPSYPFERQRYWLERHEGFGQNSRRRPLKDWGYAPVWRSARLPASVARAAEELGRPQETLGCALVLGDVSDVTRALVERLRTQGRKVIVANAGSAFVLQEDRCTLDPYRRDDYLRLIHSCVDAYGPPSLIVHLWAMPKVGQNAAEERADGLEDGFFSLLYLLQALGEAEVTAALRIAVVTSGVYAVSGLETISPERAAVAAFCRVTTLEHPHIVCRHIDIEADAAGASAEALAQEVLAEEVLSGAEEPVVAYRHGRRWAESFAPLHLPESASEVPPILRQGGSYLITGGLGGMGLTLARYLAGAVRAKLTLVGRTTLPERSAWPQYLSAHPDHDAIGRKIRAVLSLEEAGAEVLTLSADVSDEEQMGAVIEQVRDRFGAVDGVIHAAGVPPSGVILSKEPAQARAVLAPKVQGTRVLERLLSDCPPDFIVLCSSLNSVKGFPGAVDYTAANLFLNAFASAAEAKPRPYTVSIVWNRWREVGMAAAAGELAVDKGISNAEGVEVFRRVLMAQLGPQVLVSEFDLFEVLSEKSSSITSASEQDGQQHEPARSDVYERPNLGTEYAAPRDELQQQLVQMWQRLFGIEPIGIDDDFFELGGHSLLAIQLLNQLRQDPAFSELSLRALFDARTVAGLALWRRAAQPSAAEAEAQRGEPAVSPLPVPAETVAVEQRLDNLLANPDAEALDTLSDDDVNALLHHMLTEQEPPK